MFTRIVKIPIKFIAYVVHSLPQFLRRLLGKIFGILWFDVFRVRRKTAIDNVKKVFPKLSDKEATKMARTSLFHMGWTMMDYFSMPFYKKDDILNMFEFEGDGKERLQKAVEEGKGVFIISAHLGNYDLAGAALSHSGFKIHVVSKFFKSQWLNDMWFPLRRRHGIKFIAPKKSSYDILKALKAKEVVIFVLDQYTGPPNGIQTNFFGIETGTAFGPALFAQRSKAPIVPVYTYRKDLNKHVIVVGDPVPFEELEDKRETLRHNTQNYNTKIEEIVTSHPEQWMWVHRRWKQTW